MRSAIFCKRGILCSKGDGGAGSEKPSLNNVSNSEADKLAKQNGYKDAHDLKEAYVGKSDMSKFNIKVDSKTGQIYLEGLQNGAQIPTGLYR